MWCTLTALDAQHNFTDDFEFLPVDARLVLPDESPVAFLGGDEVATVERQERDAFRERILPRQTVREVASLCPHEDDQPHEILLRL